MCPRPFLNGYRCRKRLNPLSTFPGSYHCTRMAFNRPGKYFCSLKVRMMIEVSGMGKTRRWTIDDGRSMSAFAFLVYGLSSVVASAFPVYGPSSMVCLSSTVAFAFPMAFRIANNFLDSFSL